MAHIDILRNGIINKLLSISDKSFLQEILDKIESDPSKLNPPKLSPEQRLMLEMSEADIDSGRIISLSDLDKHDLEWLDAK
jgi:hypothetical protein